MDEETHFHTPIELEEALETITAEDLISLKQFARFKLVFNIVPYDEEDLLMEALRRSLDGSRRWNKNLTIRQHLIGVMRSISGDYRRGNTVTEEINDRISSGSNIGLDSGVATEQVVKAMFSWYQEDDHETTILCDMLEGLSRAETVSSSDITEKEYNAARKRIVREMIRRRERGEF